MAAAALRLCRAASGRNMRLAAPQRAQQGQKRPRSSAHHQGFEPGSSGGVPPMQAGSAPTPARPEVHVLPAQGPAGAGRAPLAPAAWPPSSWRPPPWPPLPPPAVSSARPACGPPPPPCVPAAAVQRGTPHIEAFMHWSQKEDRVPVRPPAACTTAWRLPCAALRLACCAPAAMQPVVPCQVAACRRRGAPTCSSRFASFLPLGLSCLAQ